MAVTLGFDHIFCYAFEGGTGCGNGVGKSEGTRGSLPGCSRGTGGWTVRGALGFWVVDAGEEIGDFAVDEVVGAFGGHDSEVLRGDWSVRPSSARVLQIIKYLLKRRLDEVIIGIFS